MPRYHHGDLRAAILKAGREALRSGGADGLSLRELARSVGVSPSATYRHFADREAVLSGIALAGFEELRNALKGGDAAGARASLEQMLERYAAFFQQNPELLAVMFSARSPVRNKTSGLKAVMGECLAEFVAAASVDGEAVEPEVVIRRAVRAWSAAHGFAALRVAGSFEALDQWMLPTALELVTPRRRRPT